MSGAPDLKMRITVQDGLPAALERNAKLVQASQAKTTSASEAAAAKQIAIKKKLDAELLRLQYDVDRAAASEYSNLFGRQRAMEQAEYVYRKAKYQENVDARLLIEEKHAIKLAAISKRESEYATQPFQRLLAELATISGLGGFKARAAEGLSTFAERGITPRDPLGGMAGLAGAGGAAGERAAIGTIGGEAEAASAGIGGAAGFLSNPVVLAATVGIGAFAVGLHHAAEVAKEYREAEEQLNIALENSGRAFPIELLNKYADAIQRTTNFSAMNAKSAEAVLLGVRGLSSTEIPKLIKLSADLAASPGFDGSMVDAAKKLALAFEEPEKGAKALRSATIVLSSEELKRIKTLEEMGQKDKAQALIYDMLQTKVGGYAEKTKHATDEMGNDWREFEAVVGKVALHVGDAIASIFVGNEDTKRNTVILQHLDVLKKYGADELTFWKINREQRIKIYDEIVADDQKKDNKVLAQADKAGVGAVTATKERTDAQQALFDKYNQDLEAAQATSSARQLGTIQEEAQKQINAANDKYAKEKKADLGFGDDLKKASRARDVEIANIHADEADKLAKKKDEDDKKALDAVQKTQAARSALEFAEARASKESVAADPTKNLEAKKAALEEERQVELDALTKKYDDAGASNILSLEDEKKYRDARARINKTYDDKEAQAERDAWTLQKRIQLEKMSFGLQIAGNLAEVASIIGGKNKAIFAAEKALALGTIAVKTAEAVVTDNSTPLTWWKVPFDIALGASEAAVVGAQALKGFRIGGYTGSGFPGDMAGIVHKEEYVVDAPSVRALGGPQGVESALGGGGDTYHVNVVIPAGMTPAQAEKVGYAITDGMRKKTRDNAMIGRFGDRIRQQA